MRRFPFRRLGILLVSVILLPQSVEAEGMLHLDGLRGRVRLESTTYYDERERSSSKTSSTETILREELTLGTSGWVYDPGLLQFDGSLSVIPEQNFIDSDQLGKGNETGSWNFLSDIFLSLLPKKSYPMTFYMAQNIIDIQAPFAPSRKTETSQYGTTLSLPKAAIGEFRIPIRLLFQRDEMDIDTNTKNSGLESRYTDRFELNMDNATLGTGSHLKYEFETIDSETRKRKTPTQDRHKIDFQQDQRIPNGTSRSRLYFFDYSGSTDLQTLNFLQDVTLRHGQWLSSNYRYTFDRREYEGREQLRHQARTYLRHQWYDSLTSQLTLEGSYLDSDTGELTIAATELSLYYRKIIPGGNLGLHFIPRYSYHDEEFEMDVGTVIAESHPVDIAQPMRLEQSNVLEDSIRVIDPNTLYEYAKYVDYLVIVSGGRTVLEIVPGRELDPGSTTVDPPATVVNVSYDFETGPSSTYYNFDTSSGLSLELWDRLRFDITYLDTNVYVREERTLPGVVGRENPALTDYSRLTANLEYKFREQRMRFEYRDYDELINPRKSYGVLHHLNYRSSTNFDFGSSLSYHRVDEETFNRTLDVYALGLTGSGPLPLRIRSQFGLNYRRLERWDQEWDQVSGTINFSYRMGLILLELEDRTLWERTKNIRRTGGGSGKTEDLSTTVMFRITRPF